MIGTEINHEDGKRFLEALKESAEPEPPLRREWADMRVHQLEKRTFWAGIVSVASLLLAAASLVWAFVQQRQMETMGAEHYSLNGKLERILGEMK